ncbi:hypothetical protein PUR57_02585 [Streptomyces sp. JV176]|uniref:hypothetical protein n=1 Tax=Streptomyces sp. JV176 TaxID=858630 RepID=UPI002E7633C4|nr:hypothetical protein [Streptomyces sp. JV176]MEE1797580.1 hypothetical protein [Streptomyces sp. JV176]
MVEVYSLRRATRAALTRWFLVRRLLMVDVTGTADAVWVSVRGNHGGIVDETGSQYRPAGITLQPRGAGRAYTAAVAKVNAELAGTEDWSPLPERMEQLRWGFAAPSHAAAPGR